jgi:purine-cytosine permease-like protein
MEEGNTMIAIGLVLLLLGLLTAFKILFTIGIVLLAIGLLAAFFGYTGSSIGPRQHYW